jgi:hypothetical protein
MVFDWKMRALKTTPCKQEIKHPEMGVCAYSQVVEESVDADRGQVGDVEAGAESISSCEKSTGARGCRPHSI